VCLSADARTVATAGEDGSIFVLKVGGLALDAAKEGQGGARRVGSSNEANAGGEVVMINRGEIQARQEEIEMLSAECAALKIQLAEDAVRLQAECRARAAAARQQDQEMIQSLRLKYESLQQSANAKERESLRVMKAMEAQHVQAADNLEAVYDKKIRQEADQFISLENVLGQLTVQLETLRDESQQSVEEQRQRQKQELQKRLSEKDHDLRKLKDLISFSQHRYDTMLDQEGMEHDLELAELNRRNQAELEAQRHVEYKLKKDQDTLMRGLDMMEKEHDRISKEQEDASIVVNKLKAEAEAMQREVASLKAERRDREATLRDKELEIGAHKVKANTLKKFKHVLDFRLQEVTLSLQPKDEMIAQLNAQLRDLEAQFELQLEVQKQMEVVVEQKKEQIAEVAEECKQLRAVLKQRERTISRFHTDLHDLVTEEQDVRKWPLGMKKIYRDHVDPDRIFKDGDLPGAKELGWQIKVVQKKAVALADKSRKTEATCSADIMHKMHENSLLIQELNEIRVEQKVLNRETEDLELRCRQAERRLAEKAAKGAPLALGAGAGSPLALTQPESGIASESIGIGSGSMNAAAAASFFGPKAKAQAQPHLKSAKESSPALIRASPTRVSPEERRQMQRLLATSDLNQQQITMQRLEHKLLNDQLQKLVQERKPSTAAGGGLAAARSGGAAASGDATVAD